MGAKILSSHFTSSFVLQVYLKLTAPRVAVRFDAAQDVVQALISLK